MGRRNFTRIEGDPGRDIAFFQGDPFEHFKLVRLAVTVIAPQRAEAVARIEEGVERSQLRIASHGVITSVARGHDTQSEGLDGLPQFDAFFQRSCFARN